MKAAGARGDEGGRGKKKKNPNRNSDEGLYEAMSKAAKKATDQVNVQIGKNSRREPSDNPRMGQRCPILVAGAQTKKRPRQPELRSL